jgi:hypothetical protein
MSPETVHSSNAMVPDANNSLTGVPATTTQGVGPAGHMDPGATTQNASYPDNGVTSVLNQFSGLALGSGVPHFPGYSLVNHPTGLYYSPAMYGTAQTNGPLMTGANAPFWVHDPSKAAYVKAMANDDSVNRNQPIKYYDVNLGANHADVPALENRRSSYSTTESTPATPFYGSTASRDNGARVTIFERGSSTYTTPSPPQVMSTGLNLQPKGFSAIPLTAHSVNGDLRKLIDQEPAIPLAVPAVFTPRENMKTVEQSLANNIPGNRNVYIRGLHPTTDDDLLLKYAERFGTVETSKAIIDTATGACKGYVYFFSLTHPLPHLFSPLNSVDEYLWMGFTNNMLVDLDLPNSEA